MFSMSNEEKNNLKLSASWGMKMGLTTGIFVMAGLISISGYGCPQAFDWKTVGVLGAVGSVANAHYIQNGPLINRFLKKNDNSDNN